MAATGSGKIPGQPLALDGFDWGVAAFSRLILK
jgi:hypothetical protein